MIKGVLPRSVKHYLKAASGIADLGQRVAALGAAVGGLEEEDRRLRAELTQTRADAADLRGSLGGCWVHGNPWEPGVSLALRDLCRPGGVAYDLGANVGGLTVLMSRLVGPRGAVVAVEASPRTIHRTHQTLIFNGCGNVLLYHAALHAASNQRLPLYYGPGHNQADSLVAAWAAPGSEPACLVPTVALDDLVEHTQLVPAVVKMDIEGAEFAALKGSAKLLRDARPHLILETQFGDDPVIPHLRSLGYRVLDLTSYREVGTPEAGTGRAGMGNVLGIHADRLAGSGYSLPVAAEPVATLTPEGFQASADGSLAQREPLVLPPGRYLYSVAAAAGRHDNEMKCGLEGDTGDLFYYHCNTAHLFPAFGDWIVHLAVETPVKMFFRFQRGTTDPTFRFERATVARFHGFADRPAFLFT